MRLLPRYFITYVVHPINVYIFGDTNKTVTYHQVTRYLTTKTICVKPKYKTMGISLKQLSTQTGEVIQIIVDLEGSSITKLDSKTPSHLAPPKLNSPLPLMQENSFFMFELSSNNLEYHKN